MAFSTSFQSSFATRRRNSSLASGEERLEELAVLGADPAHPVGDRLPEVVGGAAGGGGHVLVGELTAGVELREIRLVHLRPVHHREDVAGVAGRAEPAGDAGEE